jgi:peptidoglycan/xylan/chitin deacetylase (PgdA/CDA1 family)
MITKLNRGASFAATLLCLVIFYGCGATSRPDSEPAAANAPRARGDAIVAESAEFLIVTAAAGDSFESLAERYLGASSKGWMIEEFNDARPLAAGQTIVIPKKFWNPAGVYPNGYQLVPILCYHDIGPNAKGRLLIGEKTFQEQMRYLKNNGFRTVTLTEYYEFLTQKRQLPRKTVVITFDDGYKSFLKYAYPALKEVGFTATLFVYTDYVGAGGNAFSWAELKKLADEGFQVEAHTKTHGNLRRNANESVSNYQNRLRAELEFPLGVFQKNINRNVQFLAYPYGAQDDLVVERTRGAGYLAAFTVRPQSSYAFIDPYRIHRVQIFSEMKLDDFAGYLNIFHGEDLK